MGIICDHPGCTNRTRQPLPAGWDVEWAGDRRYEHKCPEHSKRALSLAVADAGKAPRKPSPPRTTIPAPPEDDDQGSLF